MAEQNTILHIGHISNYIYNNVGYFGFFGIQEIKNLIPVILAFLVYAYNYRKILDIKNEIKKIENVMSDERIWNKLDELGDRINKLEIKFSKLETRITIYVGIVIFVSSAVLKYIDKFL